MCEKCKALIRGHKVRGVPQGVRGPSQLGDVEHDFPAVDVAFKVSKLATVRGRGCRKRKREKGDLLAQEPLSPGSLFYQRWKG